MRLLKHKNSTEPELRPEDVKFVSKEEAYWTQIKEKTFIEIETLQKMLKFNEAILVMAQEKINNEH